MTVLPTRARRARQSRDPLTTGEGCNMLVGYGVLTLDARSRGSQVFQGESYMLWALPGQRNVPV